MPNYPDRVNLLCLGKFTDLNPIESIPIGTAVTLGTANENAFLPRGQTPDVVSVVNLQSNDIGTGAGVFDTYEKWPSSPQGISSDVVCNTGSGTAVLKLDASFQGNVPLTLVPSPTVKGPT